jgi:hypothetical protein
VSDITEFIWRVPFGGHRWIKSAVHKKKDKYAGSLLLDAANEKGPSQWVLTDWLGDGSPSAYEMYRPLERETGLYKRFLEIDSSDRGSILEFADEYGSLGVNALAARPATLDDANRNCVFVETWETWKEEIENMRRTVTHWKMVESKDSNGLSRYFTENARGTWLYKSDAGGFQRVQEPVQGLFAPGNVLIPAGFLVQDWVNQQLRQSTYPQVLYDVERGSRILQIVPRSLLGAMWLQFAQTIDGKRSHKPCKECSTWFEVSTEDTGKRVNREFCSDPCKSKNYRRRKAECIQLKAQGMTASAIAKQLDTSIETIKTWLSTKKG